MSKEEYLIEMNVGIRNIILILLGVIGTLALVYGKAYSMPDNVGIRYGLPLIWGTNVLSTFAGPVNLWSVDTVSLAIDVAFWFTVLIVSSAILNFRRARSKDDNQPVLKKTT
jgi:hypothetical protein